MVNIETAPDTTLLKALNDLQMLVGSDNMAVADTVEEMKNHLLFKEKEKMVVEMHGSKFNPRTITKRGQKVETYKTKHKGRQIQANDYKSFIDKVAEAYGISDNSQKRTNLSVDEVFQLALDEKNRTENNSENTITKLNDEYLRFISQDFRNRQIKDITEIYLKEYTQNLTRDLYLKKKAFYAYKGILNLIFEYALYHKIIPENPVKAIKNSVYLKSVDTSKPKNTEKILSVEEIAQVIEEANKRIQQERYNGYCVYAFVVKLAIETGMRSAELCSLKTSDIKDGYIHIHSQQLYKKRKGGKDYYYVNHTKGEKGLVCEGRYFPITPEIQAILDANEECKKALGLDSEFVFCRSDGEWIRSDAYETFLRRMMQSLGMPVTNNHAFRMSLNSNVFIPLGINVADRAELLGHSIETNLKYYSFARKDNLVEIKSILSGANNGVTPGHPSVVPFVAKKESPETLISQCF